jgi:hypothetical protein
MERLELLRDTIILEALNYTGEIKPVLERKNSLPGEFVGYMDELEKRLHTLSVLKNNEIGEMFENITSDLPEETTPDERAKHIREVITSKDDFHLYRKFNKLQKEATASQELMLTLIKLRFVNINLILEIRPGFQIVSLPNTEFLTLEMLGFVES